VKAVGEGFGIIDGEFKITSGALNPSHGDDYHDDGAGQNPKSKSGRMQDLTAGQKSCVVLRSPSQPLFGLVTQGVA